MQVNFKTRKLQKIFNSERALQKNYGADTAKRIGWRMKVLKYAPNLSLIPVTRPERLHQLTGDRAGQFAVDLTQKKRLVFSPNHDPLPIKKYGGLDKSMITSITILEVVDYH